MSALDWVVAAKREVRRIPLRTRRKECVTRLFACGILIAFHNYHYTLMLNSVYYCLAVQIPSPAHYPAPRLPAPSGGRFNKGKSKSDLDWVIHRSKQLPGPGQYTPTVDRSGSATMKVGSQKPALTSKQRYLRLTAPRSKVAHMDMVKPRLHAPSGFWWR